MGEVYVDAAALHRIFADVVVQVFKYAPQAASIGADHQRFPRGIDDELQMSGIQFFFKFAVGLKCHLDEVNVGKFKLHIAGACLGCLDEVFNQCFETL